MEESLRHLETDTIDLYFMHRDDLSVEVGEILETLEEEVKKGNIRYYGCSNWSLDRVKEAESYAASHGLQGFSCNQLLFGLTDVNEAVLGDLILLDDAWYQYHKESGLNFMAYMCQAGGYFGKRLAGKPVPQSKLDWYGMDSNEEILKVLEEYEHQGYSYNDFLLHYVREVPFPSVPIAAFGNKEQLHTAVKGISREIPEEMLMRLRELKKAQVYQW